MPVPDRHAIREDDDGGLVSAGVGGD